MELSNAIEGGVYTDVVNLVKNKGLDVHVVNEVTKDNTLHIAAYFNKDEKIASFLIAQGVKINVQNENGLTPLHYAIDRKNEKVAHEILSHKPDLTILDSLKRSVLFLAIIQGLEKIALEILATKGFKEDHSANIFAAVESGLVKVVESLLKHGASIDGRDVDGNTILIKSISKGNSPLMKTILAHGPNVNAMNTINDSAIHFAALKGDDGIDLLSGLLKHGKTLLKKTSLSMDMKGNNGMTALHLLASLKEKNKLSITKLLKYKPKKDIKNNAGKIAKDVAIDAGCEGIAKLL